MSFSRIDTQLKQHHDNLIPVPRGTIKGIKEDTLSKKIRRFDNIGIVTPLSEQAGIYINTNETGVRITAKALEEYPRIHEPFHIGFSGWHNFDIMAQRHSTRAFIADMNPENALFLHYVLKYLRRYSDRFEFIAAITEFIKKHEYYGSRTNADRPSYLGQIRPKSIKFSLNVSEESLYFDHVFVAEEIAIELKRETSWLYTPERYAHIRGLALGDKIALITENICASDTFSAICKLLIDNSIQIDTVYVSNIGDWMSTESQRHSFIRTLQRFLTDKQTIVIDATRGKDSTLPIANQRCTSLQQLAPLSLEEWFFPKKTLSHQRIPSDTDLSIQGHRDLTRIFL